MIRVGTAGWAVSARYQALFESHGSHLERYAQRLNAVEINSSFYRHHRVQTYARWAESVPDDFQFAVKLPRTLTHAGALTLQPEVLDRFTVEVKGLGRKLGVLLAQFPPALAFEADMAKRFFHGIRERVEVPLICEPRHRSWGLPVADKTLTECAVARVAADPPPWLGADFPGGNKQLAYFRWHGAPRKYYSEYDQMELESLWRQIVVASRTAKPIWCIFDNTALGHALGNALTTMDFVESASAHA